MKKISLLLMVVFVSSVSFGQKYFTKNGKINFDATSPGSPERVEAVNKTVTCVIDTKTGNMQFAALMKGFEFERALMQEHFNENYVESDKFPKAEFKGLMADKDAVNYSKDGTYTVKVKGKLTIHGETKDVETDGKFVVQNGRINALADFNIILSDYRVSIPGLVADKVSKTAKISVACQLELFKG
ncbi:MAG TPA: YceI family protein [Chitinophagaceae bacterium]|nr:YceI family protein [Chitinophagaceae bacterium]